MGKMSKKWSLWSLGIKGILDHRNDNEMDVCHWSISTRGCHTRKIARKT